MLTNWKGSPLCWLHRVCRLSASCDVVVLVRNGEDEFPAPVCPVVRLARVVDDLASKLVRCGCPPLGWFTKVNDHTVGRGMRGHLGPFVSGL